MVYTNEQAVEDGVKVNVTEWAREVGFTLPVYVTRGVWEKCIEWQAEDSRRQVPQDIRGRAHDVLYLGSLAARKLNGDWFAEYQVLCVPRGGTTRRTNLFRLWLTVDGDSITILLPDEY